MQQVTRTRGLVVIGSKVWCPLEWWPHCHEALRSKISKKKKNQRVIIQWQRSPWKAKEEETQAKQCGCGMAAPWLRRTTLVPSLRVSVRVGPMLSHLPTPPKVRTWLLFPSDAFRSPLLHFFGNWVSNTWWCRIWPTQIHSSPLVLWGIWCIDIVAKPPSGCPWGRGRTVRVRELCQWQALSSPEDSWEGAAFIDSIWPAPGTGSLSHIVPPCSCLVTLITSQLPGCILLRLLTWCTYLAKWLCVFQQLQIQPQFWVLCTRNYPVHSHISVWCETLGNIPHPVCKVLQDRNPGCHASATSPEARVASSMIQALNVCPRGHFCCCDSHFTVADFWVSERLWHDHGQSDEARNQALVSSCLVVCSCYPTTLPGHSACLFESVLCFPKRSVGMLLSWCRHRWARSGSLWLFRIIRSLWTKFRSELPLPGQERSHQMRADSRWNWVYTEQIWGGNFGERGRRTASHSLDAAGSRPFCNILRKMNHVHKTLTCLSCRH